MTEFILNKLSNVFIFVLLCFCVNTFLQVASYSQRDFDKLAEVCNVTKEDLDVCKKYEVPETPAGKCFLKCVMKAMGMMSSSGDFDKDASIKIMIESWPQFSSELNTNVINECHTKVSPVSKEMQGTCEFAYKVMKCLNEVTRKHDYYKVFLES